MTKTTDLQDFNYFLKGDVSGIQDFIFNVRVYKIILFFICFFLSNSIIAQGDSTMQKTIETVGEGIKPVSNFMGLVILVIQGFIILVAFAGLVYWYRKQFKEIDLFKKELEDKVETTKKEVTEKVNLMESEVENKIALQVESKIGEKSEQYVQKYFAEKLGVKPEIIRSLFRQFEKEYLIKENKKIVVLTNNGGGRVKKIYEFLHDYHEFKNVNFVDVLKTENLDTNNIDLLLLNNLDKEYFISDEMLLEIVKEFKDKTKIHHVGHYLSHPDLKEGIEGFTTDKNKLPGNLIDALR